MPTLALETSTSLGSVAIGRGAHLLAESVLSVRATHSETVLDEIDRVCARTGVGPQELIRVVVGSGPGSFTGVRIAAALAKGLCHARDLPLFAYSSLWAVAATAGVSPVCALFDARRGEVYAATFEGPAAQPPVRGPEVLLLPRLLEELGDLRRWTFAGEGATKHAEAITAAGGRSLPAHLGVPRASALLWLARTVPDAGAVEDRERWEPEYVRLPGARREALRVNA